MYWAPTIEIVVRKKNSNSQYAIIFQFDQLHLNTWTHIVCMPCIFSGYIWFATIVYRDLLLLLSLLQLFSTNQ